MKNSKETHLPKICPSLKMNDLFTSGLLERMPVNPKNHRVINNTRLEELVYRDIRSNSPELDTLEEKGLEKLESFKELVQDMFHSLYSINVSFREESELSTTARKFNRNILNKVMDSEEYPALKMLSEGRELESSAAIGEFSEKLLEHMEELLKDVSGEKGTLKVLSNIENQCQELKNSIEQMAEQITGLQASGMDTSQLEKKALEAANKLQSKATQAERLNSIVDQNLAKNKEAIKAIITAAVKDAANKAQEMTDLILAWGNGPGHCSKMDSNAVSSLTQRVKNSCKLSGITKLLGRYKQVLEMQSKNGYSYGRGEKYDIEQGNKIDRLVTSEYALLAAPETMPLFMQKYQKRTLKQYRRREPESKGKGDIIVCMDESGSTSGGKEYWGKALALTLLEAAAKRRRSFALIHFSDRGSTLTHRFYPGRYSSEDIMAAAEAFLDGGTDFETPLSEAIQLMTAEKENYSKADIVFITDGECGISNSFLEAYKNNKKALKFRTVGILLDKGSGSCSTSSLKSICDVIYRTSEMDEDGIAKAAIAAAI